MTLSPFKRIFIFIVFNTLCFSAPLSINLGINGGWNNCVVDCSNERLENHTSNGLHGGIMAGYNIRPYLAFNIIPQYKTTSDICGHWPGTDYFYTNLFIPVIMVVKLKPTHSVSPYLGIGCAVNFQLSGIERDNEWIIERPIEDLGNDLYFTTFIGLENKLARFRIAPEFSFNYNLTDHTGPADSELTKSIYDFDISIGLYYAL